MSEPDVRPGKIIWAADEFNEIHKGPHQVTKDFERALCDYTGAPYAVAVTSCTMALLLVLEWVLKPWPYYGQRPRVGIPKKTYLSVPQCVLRAGASLAWYEEEWSGAYPLLLDPMLEWDGTPVDSARRFTSGMFLPTQYQCVSFHASKILGDSQGGAILHDNPEADAWFRRMRFDGRTEGLDPKDDNVKELGYHCYMSPDVAARLLWKLSVLPKHNPDLPNSNYPDLSLMEAFKHG